MEQSCRPAVPIPCSFHVRIPLLRALGRFTGPLACLRTVATGNATASLYIISSGFPRDRRNHSSLQCIQLQSNSLLRRPARALVVLLRSDTLLKMFVTGSSVQRSGITWTRVSPPPRIHVLLFVTLYVFPTSSNGASVLQLATC